jgi:Dihaem cytochrome c
MLKRNHILFSSVLAVLLLLGATHSARADSDKRSTPLLPVYKAECSACHVAYPPGMLPAASWKRLMGNLPGHFGVDASLDVATVSSISNWLDIHAGSYKRMREEPGQDRITRSSWFVRKHDEIDPATWKRASIKSASNCAACHTLSDQGNFDEHAVRIPK